MPNRQWSSMDGRSDDRRWVYGSRRVRPVSFDRNWMSRSGNLVGSTPVQIAVWGPLKRGRCSAEPKNAGDKVALPGQLYCISQGDVWNVHPQCRIRSIGCLSGGRPVRINQGFKGQPATRNDYAIDLDMPVGTPVTMARSRTGDRS